MQSQPSSSMLKKEDKERIRKPDFIEPSTIAKEMDELMKYYETDASKADMEKTRKILASPKVSSLNKELIDMREENMMSSTD